MTIDEGGVQKGSISDCISGVYAKRAQPKEVQLDRFVHQTALLRKYLLQLADPMDNLFTRYDVRGLLEEARSIYLSKAREQEGKDLLYPSRLPQFEVSEYKVCELRPPIYQQIVLDPQPRESFRLGIGKVVDLDTLIIPDNFRGLIPKLEGYGFALQASWITQVLSHRSYEMKEEGYIIPNSWPGGSVFVPGRTHHSSHMEVIDARVTKSLCVEAEVSESAHVLKYSHQFQRDDLRSDSDRIHEFPRQDDHSFLSSPKKVSVDDPAESLSKLIGDDIVRELDGKYKELIGMLSYRDVANIYK